MDARNSNQKCKAVAAAAWLIIAASVATGFSGQAETTTIYSTGFERTEGFDPRLTLIGQGGWTGTDTNGNGIVTDYFVNTTPQQPFGVQQAFVGFYPLTRADGILNVWRPLRIDPVADGAPIVTFSTTIAIYDSDTTTNRDCFRWSVYNMVGEGDRLFTLDFDNTTTEINYELDDEVFVPTGFLFERAGEYDLVVTMNFADNLWSATLQGGATTPTVIVDSQPMTTRGLALNLGDIDAVWVSRELGRYGDNFMVFDNYTVSAEPYPVWLDAGPRLTNGVFSLRLTGEPGRKYAIDVTTDFVDWYALTTNSAGMNGTFDFMDRTATDYPYSFYRARQVE